MVKREKNSVTGNREFYTIKNISVTGNRDFYSPEKSSVTGNRDFYHDFYHGRPLVALFTELNYW